MNKKYIVRLSDEERGVCQDIVKRLKGTSEKVKSGPDAAQGGCGWAGLAGCEDRGGIWLLGADGGESS